MAKERSPLRRKAFKIWCDSGRTMKPSQIANKLRINPSLVRKWKSVDDWENRSNPTVGAPYGNKNALGNKGGGAPPRNKNAVTHGMYETIWADMLDPAEQIKLMQVETDPRKQVENEIRFLELRERRMLERINKINEGWDSSSVVSESALIKDDETDITVIDDNGKTTHMKITQPVFKEVARKVKTPQVLERILAIEDALTRVQDKKAKLIELLLKIDRKELDREEQLVRIEKLRADVKLINSKAW
ncbi:phage terminase small subunit [Paenibacillus aquistagni]|uniref:Uncharacterized protein YjcR n=1 Tax=Paenibacillus aquistagni TaxID=1852522 RepID=A0A1X7LWN7_9BACL|nr:phage terminase small subunit [Paenibacillus aquistagni]SMG58271.1 Uncharacterized protein YjcR [Paenibacillus aquistagni]